ncbi:exonuclease domain-containing protein [Candidatus Pelagibacter bacterium nBUS_27]|uniref:exonuclease domain-containing protein n=1 Tax=Candidatus Pelagibacter bacterium nBUS_27 TaxID=3374188 RepID=UPI003EB6DD02
MNYVVWDIETDSAQTDWATIIEIGGILLDENFKELERFQARCRLPQDRVPSATALCINKSNVDLLTKGNLSHYEMLTQVEQKFRQWSPATFLGYSSINFDDEVIRKEFFKSLRKPYLTNTDGNVRHDALNIVRAAFAIDDDVLKTELNPKGNKSMKLESLARLNGFESAGAHSALFDTELTVKVLDLIKKKQPTLWQEYFKTSSRVIVENLIKQEKIFTLNEYFYGTSRLYLCAPLHPNACMHPTYNWGQAVDLRVDVEAIQKLNYEDLKKEMKKSPKFLRTIRSNKAPIILDQSFGMKVEPYSKLDPNLLKKRAELVKTNEKFSQDICNILREAAEEKMETSSQEDIEPEESIYSGGMDYLKKDGLLFQKFHSEDWKGKFAMIDKFKDERLVTFAHSLIFNEAPEILPKEIHKKIKRRIASRILSTNKEKWWTISAFYSECDEIRENEDKMFSFKTVDEKLKFLDGINDYVMNLEQKYSDA